jgi:hypothetical protein
MPDQPASGQASESCLGHPDWPGQPGRVTVTVRRRESLLGGKSRSCELAMTLATADVLPVHRDNSSYSGGLGTHWHAAVALKAPPVAPQVARAGFKFGKLGLAVTSPPDTAGHARTRWIRPARPGPRSIG